MIHRFAPLALAVSAAFFGVAAQAATGPSSSQTPYLTATAPGVSFTSVLTTGDSVGGYRMGGIPDGMGAYDNGDGTFTLLMNHELGNTAGVTRAHGAKGAYVSEWVINKSTLQVVSGRDLIQSVKNTDGSAYAGSLSFARMCSADLAASSAFYNAASGLGSQARIFMNGEESSSGVPGSVGSRALAHVATGADKGTSYVLSKFGAASWENLAANSFAQDKTVVVGQSDGTANVNGRNVSGAVAVWVGQKQATGNEVQKAGLADGQVYYVNVPGVTAESRTLGLNGASTFSLSTSAATSFSRPEDGAWDTLTNNTYYFVTTDQLDTVRDGVGSQVGRSRLWKLSFNDIANPNAGGSIEMLLNGTEGQNMLDNMTVNADGTLLLQEDTGGNDHNAKGWRYDPVTKKLTQIYQHDVARFGTIGQKGSLTNDEESSGIFDVTGLLGRNDGKQYSLLVVQNHKGSTDPALVEGGQLLLMTAVPEPETYALMLAGLVGVGVAARRRKAQ